MKKIVSSLMISALALVLCLGALAENGSKTEIVDVVSCPEGMDAIVTTAPYDVKNLNLPPNTSLLYIMEITTDPAPQPGDPITICFKLGTKPNLKPGQKFDVYEYIDGEWVKIETTFHEDVDIISAPLPQSGPVMIVLASDKNSPKTDVPAGRDAAQGAAAVLMVAAAAGAGAYAARRRKRNQ